MTPVISVVMPCFDAEEFLEESVRSILGQTWADFEFIIVDDGSTDGTLPILRSFEQQDRRVRVIAAGHSGLVAALRIGVDAAVGRYIARMDADDIAYPDRLERQVRALEDDASVAAIGSWARAIDGDGRPGPIIQRAALPSGTGKSPLLHPTALFRSSAYHAVGGYRSATEGAEDFDLWLRLWDSGHRLRNIPEVLLDYRWHGNNASGDSLRTLTARMRALLSHVARRAGAPDPLDDPEWRGTDGIPWESLARDLRAPLRADWARTLALRIHTEPTERGIAAIEEAVRAALADGCDRTRLGEVMVALGRMFWQRGHYVAAARWIARGVAADPRHISGRVARRLRLRGIDPT